MEALLPVITGRLEAIAFDGGSPETLIASQAFSGLRRLVRMSVSHGNGIYFIWNLMDSDTRFLLASQIHEQREAKHACN